jgi:hypothetical protein
MYKEEVITTTHETAAVPTESVAKSYPTKKAIFHTYKFLFYILGVIEILLAFRILLKLLGANPASGFANFIYSLSDPFALPFIGVVNTTATNGSVMEWPTFIAMAVYAVGAWLIIEFIQLVKPTNPQEVIETVDYQS